MASKKLYRSSDDRMLGGVAGGIAEYLEIDSTLVRLIFAILIISGGVGVVAYIIAWVIIPENPKTRSGKSGAEEIKEKAEKVAQEIKSAAEKGNAPRENLSFWFGVLVFLFGLMLLFQVVFGFHFWRLFFPAVIIGLGLLTIVNSSRRK